MGSSHPATPTINGSASHGHPVVNLTTKAANAGNGMATGPPQPPAAPPPLMFNINMNMNNSGGLPNDNGPQAPKQVLQKPPLPQVPKFQSRLAHQPLHGISSQAVASQLHPQRNLVTRKLQELTTTQANPPPPVPNSSPGAPLSMSSSSPNRTQSPVPEKTKEQQLRTSEIPSDPTNDYINKNRNSEQILQQQQQQIQKPQPQRQSSRDDDFSLVEFALQYFNDWENKGDSLLSKRSTTSGKENIVPKSEMIQYTTKSNIPNSHLVLYGRFSIVLEKVSKYYHYIILYLTRPIEYSIEHYKFP